jgi:rubrerythrin
MKDFKSIDEILDFAIQNEQAAADFYIKLSDEAKDKSMKITFASFAKEEQGHKARLLKIKEEGVYEAPKKTVMDLKIADYLAPAITSDSMSYQDALILAMKREKAAFKLYTKLAEMAPNDGLKAVFKNLANDEAKHKLNFELEYDEMIYREN